METGAATRVAHAALALLSLALAPLASLGFDGKALVTGGEVSFYGVAETNWLNGAELLLKFEGEGSFVLPGSTKARILAIGGGGGGGGICTSSTAMSGNYGGGGGGGAGGFVEDSDIYAAATYSVAVGAGGAGGASSSTHTTLRGRYTGTSGGDSVIKTNEVAIVTAYGGGGGGGEGDGLAVAGSGVNTGSGGGGSAYRTFSSAELRAGGTAIDGQGFVGGSGNLGLYGGGGGGASAAGAAASTTNPIGGDGRQSDITGESLWYAGGGGGGYCNKSYTSSHDPIAGGKGGGGSGGYGLNVPCTDATFYGGGGGGCGALATSSTTRGGKGYGGVVYVRISIVAVGELVKPTNQAVGYDGKEHVLVAGSPAYTIVDMTDGSPTYGQVVDRMAGTDFGTYKAKVTLVDGFKWSDNTTDEVTVTLTISKATPVITNLSIRDWIAGTPVEATPNPGCDVSIAVTPTYWYRKAGASDWLADKPTEDGDYELRAYIEETPSYNSAESMTSFKILKGPGDVFCDYIEITIDGAAAVSADFVYTLKVSEATPVGFLYSRAGKTGEGLAFTDASGNLLDYKVEYWDTKGESTILVKLPALTTSAQKIRMFWCVREGMDAPAPEGTIDEASGAQPGYTFDLVVRNGKRVNYWLTFPSLSTNKWDSITDTPATVKDYGTLKEGTSALLYVTNLNTGAVYEGIVSFGGSFSAVFGPHDPAGDYEPAEHYVDYYVVGHVTYDDLSGDAEGLTQNGRVLLANDDSAPGGHAVNDQSYWQTDSSKYSTYWVHSEETKVTYPYLKPYAEHVLYNVADDVTNTLWSLTDIYIGNTYGSTLQPLSGRCYLPNSPTAKAISSESATPGLAEQGTMVMRNKLGAAILSPIYTNGVGTIYFDVVNANTVYANVGYYKIMVEVSVDGGVTFEPYPMNPFKRDNTDAFVTNQTDTTELTLDIANGGTDQNFYRVAVQVDVGANVQFRIVRSAIIPNSIWSEDYDGFIILDNILVSYPKSKATLEPHGQFDKDRVGRQVLGWGGAMSVPFPAIGDVVYARAKAIVDTNVNAHVAVDMPISWAQMHYRWRYLDQLTNDWQTVNLRPSSGFRSTDPLVLPADEGDVEFWYEYIIQVPAYKYYDYTSLGLDLKDKDGQPLYTEEITESTTRQMDVTGYKRLPSGGTDWFFRLRRGRSNWESFTVYTKESEDGEETECQMWVAGNNMWRGLCPTRKEVEGGLYVRVAGANLQTLDSENYDLGKVRYSLSGNATSLPAPGELKEKDNDDDWAWFTVPCDAKTGNILFQLQDDTLAYTVVHADYQDFNGWTDANKKDGKGLFVGSSTAAETNSTYTTPEAVTHASRFENWNETVATNAYWSEYFLATKAELDKGTWVLYEPFTFSLSPNTGFTVGNGQWVNGYYRDNNTGMALQMEGRGKGYIQFVNSAVSPRGLEAVTFKARIAQSIEFNDFCYLMGDPTALKNYTFMTAAAFDVNGRKDFAGNGTLSLVALYTPGEGCYEFRVEQENASINASSGVVSPGTTFRLSLYRWKYDDESEEVVAERLGTETHSNGSNMFNTLNEAGNYARLFISVDTTVDGQTRVVGGVSRDSVQRSSFFGSASYREVMYRDTTDKRLTSGTYGLLSASCPARFLNPSYGASPVKYQASDSQQGFQYGTYTITPISSRVSCQPDLEAGRWAMKKGRMNPVNETDAINYAINAVIPSTTINVYTADAGTSSFTNAPIYTATVTGFGSANKAGDTTTIPLYSLDEVSVKIAAGGTEKTARKDVVIDDIDFSQWRGESYDEKGQRDVFNDRSYGTAYGSPTNIVFTQGWVLQEVDAETSVTNKSFLLSAKRSYANVATSIRSPRMVDPEDDMKGLGLGNVQFSYENAQSNAVLSVQYSTNVSITGFADLTKSVEAVDWETFTNINFAAMSAEQRKSGYVSVYVGMHGVRGVMRVAVHPQVVKDVAKITDPSAFGEVTITGISFRDEPELDKYSWWGWNLRTTDDGAMRSLADNTAVPDAPHGMALGLNNSVTADIRTDVPAEQYKKKLPFVQTPTFATNLVNEVSFMARLYATNDPPARISLFGAASGDITEEKSWTWLAGWDISNTTYRVITKKFGPNNFYKAFRLAVTDVDGVEDKDRMDDLNPKPRLADPQRVLIDEVLVMEGIAAAVGFRNVGAFRFGLEDAEASENVPSREQQPICGEQWGVQCEIYASQLADDIDLSDARVRLWWFEGTSPWGFDKWKDDPAAGKAELMLSSESNNVYRSCHFGASAAVMKAQPRPTTVQYMLEVIYRADGQPQTNWLSSADWKTPEWYAPLDYNADLGDGSFAAYNILDTVAPGWAWINEVNIFGEYYGWNFENSDKELQFLEIAAPSEADLSGWNICFVEARLLNDEVLTNTVATFGMGELKGIKNGLKGMDPDSKCVFHVISSPLAKKSLDPDAGERDGTWSLPANYSGTAFSSSGELALSYPQSIQLVRPSGIVEHEVVFIGTNSTDGVDYDPKGHVTYLNKHERGGKWFFAGSDNAGAPVSGGWSRSLGVFKSKGTDETDWNNVNLMTPGTKNVGQVIDSQPPKPLGSALVIYSLLDGGHLSQTFGDSVDARGGVTLVYRKGSEEATNITYKTDRWYEMGAVTVNDEPATPTPTGNEREWVLPVGKATSNDVTVIASAKVDQSLIDKYGLGPENRYSDAIVQWLTRGTDAYGNPWHNPSTTTLGLADQVDKGGTVVTNLTLNEMYWLDIDPTWNNGDIWLRAYFSDAAKPRIVPATATRPCHTNIGMTAFMQMTNNAAGGTAWAPYILQGTDFAGNSWAYTNITSDWMWTNATFKITGRLLNGLTEEDNERNWIPLRWFVFTQGSFDSNFESAIEVDDPFSTASPGWNAGWRDWVLKYGPTGLGWRLDISDRGWPMSAEELKPDSTLP